ncbi:MAG: sulfotransferase domain-containing protein [Cycloclasticus sp.]
MNYKNICIIGYPKSGNTWLARMVSKALKIQVKIFVDDSGVPEVAADINTLIKESKSKVYKLHLYPYEFKKKYQKSNTYVIYIYRDPKSVFISSFFYFNYKGAGKYVMKKMLLNNPIDCLKWIIGRYKLSLFLDSFLKQGLHTYGLHSMHINAWSSFGKGNDKFVMVDYNDLIANPEKALKNLFSTLKLQVDSSDISKAAESEEFGRRKLEIINSKAEDLTFGKEFNVKFLRSGDINDWKNYLTERQALLIDKELKVF